MCHLKNTLSFFFIVILVVVIALYLLPYNEKSDIDKNLTNNKAFKKNIFHKKEKRIEKPTRKAKNSSEPQRRNIVQNKRFELIKNVCERYNRSQQLREKYIVKPGSQIRGKFTFEPSAKLVFCNIMKQGTTTWAAIFLQLYLPNAVNWRSNKWKKYSPFSVGFQVKLAEVQNRLYRKSERIRILKSLNKQNHEYLAFFVCRNPIERLKSLYSYSLDLGRFKKGKRPKNFKDFIMKIFTNNSEPIINYNPMYSFCSPCTRHYDSVIKMETFSTDAKNILAARGKERSVYLSHSNNHGSQTVTKEEIRRLFSGMSRQTIEIFVETLRPDFELCGYQKSLGWILEQL